MSTQDEQKDLDTEAEHERRDLTPALMILINSISLYVADRIEGSQLAVDLVLALKTSDQGKVYEDRIIFIGDKGGIGKLLRDAKKKLALEPDGKLLSAEHFGNESGPLPEPDESMGTY